MYVFSIDISFKGNQSLAKIMSNVTAVSYLHSGDNDAFSRRILSHIEKGFNPCIRAYTDRNGQLEIVMA
jgi:hypothetical protein